MEVVVLAAGLSANYLNKDGFDAAVADRQPMPRPGHDLHM